MSSSFVLVLLGSSLVVTDHVAGFPNVPFTSIAMAAQSRRTFVLSSYLDSLSGGNVDSESLATDSTHSEETPSIGLGTPSWANGYQQESKQESAPPTTPALGSYMSDLGSTGSSDISEQEMESTSLAQETVATSPGSYVPGGSSFHAPETEPTLLPQESIPSSPFGGYIPGGGPYEPGNVGSYLDSMNDAETTSQGSTNSISMTEDNLSPPPSDSEGAILPDAAFGSSSYADSMSSPREDASFEFESSGGGDGLGSYLESMNSYGQGDVDEDTSEFATGFTSYLDSMSSDGANREDVAEGETFRSEGSFGIGTSLEPDERLSDPDPTPYAVEATLPKGSAYELQPTAPKTKPDPFFFVSQAPVDEKVSEDDLVEQQDDEVLTQLEIEIEELERELDAEVVLREEDADGNVVAPWTNKKAAPFISRKRNSREKGGPIEYAISEENKEFVSGILGAVAGWTLGGPVAGLVGAAAMNFISRQERDLNSPVKGAAAAAIAVFNYLAKLNNRYDVLYRTRAGLEDYLGRLKGVEGVNAETVTKVEAALEKTVSRMQDVADEFDLVRASSDVLGVVGNLVEKSIFSFGKLTEDIPDRLVSLAKEAAASARAKNRGWYTASERAAGLDKESRE